MPNPRFRETEASNKAQNQTSTMSDRQHGRGSQNSRKPQLPDNPSDIDYKEQGLTIQEIHRQRRQRAASRQQRRSADTSNPQEEDWVPTEPPSDISYKDQGLTLQEIQSQRQRAVGSGRINETSLDVDVEDQGLTRRTEHNQHERGPDREGKTLPDPPVTQDAPVAHAIPVSSSAFVNDRDPVPRHDTNQRDTSDENAPEERGDPENQSNAGEKSIPSHWRHSKRTRIILCSVAFNAVTVIVIVVLVVALKNRSGGEASTSNEKIISGKASSSPANSPTAETNVPTAPPTEPNNGLVFLPNFPDWNNGEASRRPTKAPTTSVFSIFPLWPPQQTTKIPILTVNILVPDVSCPAKPQPQEPSENYDSFIYKFRLASNGHAMVGEIGNFVGECNENRPLELTMKCLDQGTPILFTDHDICSVSGSTITCGDHPIDPSWVEMGCVSREKSRMGMDVVVSDGSTTCYDRGQNGFVNWVSLHCGEGEQPSFDRPDDIFGYLEQGLLACANWGECDVSGANATSCDLYYPGARLVVRSHDVCIEPFSTSREPGEQCQWDLECASSVLRCWDVPNWKRIP